MVEGEKARREEEELRAAREKAEHVRMKQLKERLAEERSQEASLPDQLGA